MSSSTTFLSDLLGSIADRGRAFLGRTGSAEEEPAQVDLAGLCEALLSGRGEASGMALATEILAHWRNLDSIDSNQRRTFLVMLAERFGPDRGKLDRAIETYRANPDARTILNLHKAAEPRRQEVIRRLNLAPCGTEALVRIRSYGER
jgi:malonyl-CoA decarboxylase